MRTASLTDFRRRLNEIVRWIDAGEQIQITRRSRVIARVVPEDAANGAIEWPDFAGRARKIVPKAKGAKMSDLVIEGRKERLR